MAPPPIPGLDQAAVMSILKYHVLRGYERGDHSTEPWRVLPEIPNSDEILLKGLEGEEDYGNEEEDALKTSRGLPFNFVDRPWKDSASYIGAHYQLLREDALYPLRASVAAVKADPYMKDNGDTAIYTHVHIVGITLAKAGPAIKVEFSYENAGKRIRWEQSSRLQQGTIVALTPRKDMFRTICKIAVVAARPLKDGVDLNPPRVDLFWGDWTEAEVDPTMNWVMVESRSGYWESFRHLGVALQKLRSESFPLSKYLVNLENKIDAPDYIESNPYTDMTSLLPNAPMDDGDTGCDSGVGQLENFNVLAEWPSISCNLDTSQMDALKRILTKQVAIIQGPPGTGKTFVSITSLKIMLDNWQPGDPPIIISAQTNHALDQLLLLIEPYAPSLIRLGGRTTDATGVIKNRTLYEVSQLFGDRQGSSFNNAWRSMDAMRMEMLTTLNLLVHDEAITGLLLLDHKLITQEQYNSLHDDTWVMGHSGQNLPRSDLHNWVGEDQMCRLEIKCPPINTSFEEEELEEQYEKLNEEEGEARKKLNEDDFETLKGDFHELRQSWTGRRNAKCTPKILKSLLAKNKDLFEVDEQFRGELYCYFVSEVKRILRQKFRENCQAYMRCSANLKIGKWETDARLIMKLQTKVIGCTTTGLSKYRGLIASLRPRTLLVEEAAETVEGTVLAAMFESLQHLILVGDHQQLQATCNRSDLAIHPYNLSVSMFERLVNNNFGFEMLKKQRRMITEIRNSFTHVYPKLTDHDSIQDRLVNRPPVEGMAHDSFFFHHIWPESRMDTSRCNVDEAEMIVKFFDYLVLNGVDRSKITVLTFYNGQKKVLLQLLKNHPNLKDDNYFNVFTVDSYQGEENDIILLSLVRSNNEQNSGFLSNRNRIVVSLSRARRGLYLFGNVLNVITFKGAASYDVWGPVVDSFRRRNALSAQLPLTCTNHRRTVYVEKPSNWDEYRLTGGCRMTCEGELPCGHACPHNCHPFDHEQLICKAACAKILDCGHPCNQDCGSNDCYCPLCGVISDQPYISPDVELAGWQEPLGFKRAVKEAIISTPMPHPTRLANSGSSSDAALPVEPRRAASHSLNHVKGWANWDAKAADGELRIQREALAASRANDTPESNVIRTDIYRPVIVTDAGRSEPGKAIKKEHILNDTPAPRILASALSPIPTMPQTKHSRIMSEGGPSYLSSADTSPGSDQGCIGIENLTVAAKLDQEPGLTQLSTPTSLLDEDCGYGVEIPEATPKAPEAPVNTNDMKQDEEIDLMTFD